VSTGVFDVRATDWSRDRAALRAVRTAVFIVEQAIPEALEWDAADHDCVHFVAEDEGGRPIGCARLLADGHIGRVAVLKSWRGRGVGRALMVEAIGCARAHGHTRLVLLSQVHACPFYAQLGFAAEGAVFEEAGIPHQAMALAL
jgi:predicted GNAT family N-acyltransferase